MYYYKGKELGGFDVAYERVYENREMTYELVSDYIDTFTEEYAKELLGDIILGGFFASRQSMIEDALTYLSDMWLDHGGWNQVKGEREALGDFEYEDWEEEE